MGELNSFKELTDMSNKISGKQNDYKTCYKGILEVTIGEKISLPDHLYDTRYYKIYRNVILKNKAPITDDKLFGILGTRRTGKTVLAKRLHNLVYAKSIFICILQRNKISVDELIEFLIQVRSTGIDFLFVDEITRLSEFSGLNKFYEFIYSNFKVSFVTSTESFKLVEGGYEYLANRMQFIPAGSDSLSFKYFNFLNAVSDARRSDLNTHYKDTLKEFIDVRSDSDASYNLNASLQSKLDSFILIGSSLLKDELYNLSDQSIRELFKVLLEYRGRSFNIKEEIIGAVLLFTYCNVIGMRKSNVGENINSFIKNCYMPTENSDSYKDLVRMIGSCSISEYYSNILKGIGVYTEIITRHLGYSKDNGIETNSNLQVLKKGESILCSSIDLASEFLWAFKDAKYNTIGSLNISLDRANGLFTESLFCSILLEVLGIGYRSSLDKDFSVYKLKYKKDYTDYEIDCVIDYNETNRLFIGIKSGKPDVEDSLKNIPGYNPMNDRIVVVSASLGDMDYNYNSGICKMSVKQFFTEYLKRWAKEVSGLDL